MGVYETADPITTNQKVAGSSPAERAIKSPAKAGLFLCLCLPHYPEFHRLTAI